VSPEVARCRGCGSALPTPFLDLGTQPLANALLDPGAEVEARYPLAVCRCAECQLVQLERTVDPEALFSEYVYFSSYSDTFLAHAERMAATLTERFHLGRGSRVLEIASNDGYLLRYFQPRGISVLGVEPARNVAAVARGRGIPTLEAFFGPGAVERIRAEFGPADLLVGNNVLAHAPEVNPFLAAARACLGKGGVAVFEFPYLGDLLDGVEFDTVYHEHVFYLSLCAVEGLARRAGLRVFDLERQKVHGGSLRVFLEAEETGRPVSAAVLELRASEVTAGLLAPERYLAFASAACRVREELVALLARLRAGGKRLAAYGAPAKGNTLLNYCGLGAETLAFTVDRSPHKQGKLLPGSRVPVRPPETLLAEQPDYTLILPWNIAPEIVAQQAEYVRRGGRFLVPVPRPREVTV
jgi:SAM-dependent methyltransferase